MTILRPFLFVCFTLLLVANGLKAQMPVAPGDTLYGREWIEEGATYLRLSVNQPGLYRIGPSELATAGFTLSGANAPNWRLWLRGEQVPIYVNDSGLYFFGAPNRGELDRFLFRDPDLDQLNPAYSMYNDTAVYFLGLTQEPGGSEAARFAAATSGPTSGLSPEPFITRQSELVFSEYQNKKFLRTQGISIFYSHYDRAEGFGSRSINDLLSFNGETTSPFSLELPAFAAAGGVANATVRFGLGFDSHDQELIIDGQSLGNLTGINGWTIGTFTTDFTPNSSQVNGSLIGSAGDRDKASLASVSIRYPAQTELPANGNYWFQLESASQDRRLSFFGTNSGDYGLFDLTNGQLIFPATETPDFLIGAASETSEYRIANLEVTASFADVTAVVLTDPKPSQAVDFLIVTSEKLRTDNGSNDPVQAYANYRQSPAGGNHNVQLINVEDLYDQYAYGVERHPLAIRNYQADLKRLYPQLRYLFIIGKGREYNDLRSPADLEAAGATFFVPSFGLPASDNLISAAVDDVVPTLATGRLSVVNAEEVAIYLEKARGFDEQVNLPQSLEEKDWLKQIVHLGGGGVVGEQQSIRSLLEQMQTEIENNEYSGSVNAFYKTSSDPIEESREQAIFNRINEGTSIVSFFGHSSSQGFDFNIDNPDNYFNEGKYPLMLSLGCYSGDAFTSLRSIGERFVLLPEKGAIAFGASKGLGYISALGNFGRIYYDLLGGAYYGRGIGEVLNGCIEHFSNENSFTIRILLEQFGLNGDPSIRLHPQPGPDLVFDPASVSFEPRLIPAQQDSFTVKFRLVNIGQGTADSLTLRMAQQLPNGNEIDLGNYRVAVSGYDEAISLRLPNNGFMAVGPNRLLATLDSENEIPELPAPFAEGNNVLSRDGTVGFPFFVVANTARPAFPPSFSLWEGGNEVKLIASTTNPLADEQRYFLELDTNQLFVDPIATQQITQSGGLLNWQPSINWQDSTVYYWRISPDSIYNEGQGFIWNQSSFTYLANNEQPGWAVAHQGQLNAGKLTNIKSSISRREWNFARNLNDIRIRNFVYDPQDTPDWIYNGQEFGSPWPWITTNGVQVMVLDSINNRDWLRSDGSGAYGSLTHSGVRSPWSFDTRTQAGRAGLMEFIENGIPAGKYVTLYTAQRGAELDYGAAAWINDSVALGKTLFGVLETEGAEQVRQMINLGSVPYVFIFQKGNGPLGESIAQDIDSEADITVAIAENWSEGSWQSQFVGPATQWNDASLSLQSRNLSATDSVRLTLEGVTSPGDQAVSLRNELLATDNAQNFTFDLSDVDAATYPYLRARLDIFDDQNRTSVTLNQLFFHYTNTADVAIDPEVAFSGGLDSLQQGEQLDFEIGYRNISRRNMDSLLVQLTVSGDGGVSRTTSIRRPPIEAGATERVSFSTATDDLRGNVQVQLQLNPGQDQPEQIIFNNDLIKEYFFDRDRTAPVLNLYFDGVSIRDGDLVSAKPEILIELRDENQFLLLGDSSAFTINLLYPDGSSEFIANSDERLEFQPATNSNDNVARVNLRPEFPQDGTYTLSIQAGDRSGNASGRVELLREFEVINEQRVSNVFTYPNPFVDRTQFVYTLTGNVPPEVFRVQIMTVSGRVVFDVDLAQEEQLKIGTHRTQFTWDGTDQYGDRLANGVYLYRIITRDEDGLELKKYDNGTDRFFRNNMGKLVILR